MKKTGLVVLALAGLTACGMGANQNAGSTAAAPNPAQGTKMLLAGTPGQVAPQAAAADADAKLASAPTIARSATIAVKVAVLTDGVAAVRAVGAKEGAVLSAENTDLSAGDGSVAKITLRVDPDKLDETMAQVAATGAEVSRQVTATDVGADVADVGARVAADQASVDRLTTLLRNAGSIADLTTLETQLTTRQADLDALSARQRALSDEVAQATLEVDLSATRAALVTPPAAVRHTGFTDGLATGWHGLTALLRALAVTAGALLPFVPGFAVAAFLVRFLLRRRAAPRA